MSKGGHEPAPGTLGKLLYADKTKTRIPEAEWAALMRGVASGDQLALHGLYDRAHRLVFTLIMRITNDRQIAEELTLDVFHDVWLRAARYDPAGGTVLGWIMNQARSRAIDRLRYERRKKRVDPHADDPLAITAPPADEHGIELKERGRRLRDALQALTPDEREAIETTYFSELSYTEAAARLNQPLGTVKTRIRSALRKLRQVLTEKAEPS